MFDISQAATLTDQIREALRKIDAQEKKAVEAEKAVADARAAAEEARAEVAELAKQLHSLAIPVEEKPEACT